MYYNSNNSNFYGYWTFDRVYIDEQTMKYLKLELKLNPLLVFNFRLEQIEQYGRLVNVYFADKLSPRIKRMDTPKDTTGELQARVDQLFEWSGVEIHGYIERYGMIREDVFRYYVKDKRVIAEPAVVTVSWPDGSNAEGDLSIDSRIYM